MTYSISIIDQNNKQIGELMTATPSEIRQFINKGFKVINKLNNQPITLQDIDNTFGISDGAMIVG